MKNYESRIKLLIPLFLILIALFPILSFPVYANVIEGGGGGGSGTGGTTFGPPAAGLDQIEQIIGNVISVIVGLGFIAMLIMLLMAGFKYLTSGGEPKAIQSAHSTAAWAFMGILFMIGAWIALQLIAGFTGIQVTSFNIKTLCIVGGVNICP